MVLPSRSEFYLWNIGLPIVLAILVFMVFDMTQIDVTLSNLLYDPVNHTFLFGHNALFERITHKWARIIPDWVGETVIIGSILSFIWPLFNAEKHARLIGFLEKIKVAPVLRFARRHRRDFLYLLVAFSISTGCIHYLKSHTSVYCPVETTLYGGEIEKKEWFENFTLTQKAGDGRCWPGGHASSALTLIALYFVARRYRWRHAKKLLGWILFLGFVYGTTRVLQGWHYMSHTFWSGIFMWLTSLLTGLAFYGSARLAQPVLQTDPAAQALRPE